MPAYALYDMYDDDNRLIAREARDSGDEGDAYAGLGGAGGGYTRVQLDEDAQSATSLDENTKRNTCSKKPVALVLESFKMRRQETPSHKCKLRKIF
jgi:hypothetical protein